ncbi:MAG: alanine racemase [Algicola sp.]|nr:alanine racemase [Algicola sp.]
MITATAEINLTALQHNFAQVKQIAPQSKVLAVLKANAYGHGLVPIAEQLKDADSFGVARIDEALALRAGGIVKPIVLLEGFLHAQDLPILVANNIQTVVHIPHQIELILSTKLESPLNVWLKVDTGMHRLGVAPAFFEEAYHWLNQSKNVHQPMRLMTHFACADESDNDKTQQQIALFEQLTSNHVGEKTMANSAAVIAWPNARADWVRPGLMLYGVSPISELTAAELHLSPVMTLKSSLIAIRPIKKGESVGYGAAWVAQQDTNIGVIAIGYGDGYPRNAPSGTPVLINGRIVLLVGRVSMDMITIDLGSNPTEQLGDEVVLWGDGLPVEEIARLAETIPYELLCNITQRVKCLYL